MNPVTGLSLGRIAVGVASIARPDLVSSAISPSTPSGPTLLTQWFGSREIAIGTATLLATGSARRNLVLLGMAIDASDAATAYTALQHRQLPQKVGFALVGVAAGAVVSGLLGLRERKQVALAAVS